jgi:RNA polymerase sigma-70 factor (ECF subfamily)
VPVSDSQLAERVRQGDESAFAELYDRYADRLFGLASSIVRDPAAAEEAVADAFLRLWREADHDPDRGSVGAYLVMVTRSRALDQRRAAERRVRAEQGSADQGESATALPISGFGPAPDRAAELTEDRERIFAALSGLSDAQRAAIELAYFGGLTQREISERLDEPLGTVKTRMRDGMIKLREAFVPAGRQA